VDYRRLNAPGPVVLSDCSSGVQSLHAGCPHVRAGAPDTGGLGFQVPAEPEITGGAAMDYFRRLRDRLLVVHDYTSQAQAASGVRQKRGYDTRCRGRAFTAGDRVWVYCPVRKRRVCPKLRSHWQGPGEILDRVSEVVYRLQMRGLGARGRVVVLYQDRLSPYRPLAPVVAGEGGGTPRDSPGGSPADSPDGAAPPAVTAPRGDRRPNRQRRARRHLKDYVTGDRVVGDD
jgi:hypothetical protein